MSSFYVGYSLGTFSLLCPFSVSNHCFAYATQYVGKLKLSLFDLFQSKKTGYNITVAKNSCWYQFLTWTRWMVPVSLQKNIKHICQRTVRALSLYDFQCPHTYFANVFQFWRASRRYDLREPRIHFDAILAPMIFGVSCPSAHIEFFTFFWKLNKIHIFPVQLIFSGPVLTFLWYVYNKIEATSRFLASFPHRTSYLRQFKFMFLIYQGLTVISLQSYIPSERTSSSIVDFTTAILFVPFARAAMVPLSRFYTLLSRPTKFLWSFISPTNSNASSLCKNAQVNHHVSLSLSNM